MVSKKQVLAKKAEKKGIITKMLLSTFVFTILPLIVTGLLIIYAYQSLIEELLTEKGIELEYNVLSGIYSALEYAQIQALFTLFIVIILTLFSNILISRSLTNPLKKLLRGTDEVAKGNLDFKIKAESQDEIGELSEQFNRMTIQLKGAKDSLEEAKRTLEERVKQRTFELEETREGLEESKTVLEIKVKARTQELENVARSLEKQVKRRTVELQEKVAELEKFQKFAVGREMKMVALKEELAKLREEIKEYKAE